MAIVLEIVVMAEVLGDGSRLITIGSPGQQMAPCTEDWENRPSGQTIPELQSPVLPLPEDVPMHVLCGICYLPNGVSIGPNPDLEALAA